jgi:hypothetical protein
MNPGKKSSYSLISRNKSELVKFFCVARSKAKNPDSFTVKKNPSARKFYVSKRGQVHENQDVL